MIESVGGRNWGINTNAILLSHRITKLNKNILVRTSPGNGSATLTTAYIHCTASLGQTSHLFVRYVVGREWRVQSGNWMSSPLWMRNEPCDWVFVSFFDRRGERRMHFDGAEFVVRNSGHSAGFDSNNLLRVYWWVILWQEEWEVETEEDPVTNLLFYVTFIVFVIYYHLLMRSVLWTDWITRISIYWSLGSSTRVPSLGWNLLFYESYQ